jgi:predicted regulator of amino acid metabolism with ACT domain
VQDLERSGSNFEIYSLADREPMQVDQNRCDATVARFLSDNTGKGVLNELKARQSLSRCASKEGVAIVIFERYHIQIIINCYVGKGNQVAYAPNNNDK